MGAKYLIILLSIILLNQATYSNCELRSRGYHTIAGYLQYDLETLKRRSFLRHTFIKPYIFFTDYNLHENGIKLDKLGMAQHIVYNKEKCLINEEPHLIYTNYPKSSSARFSLCNNIKTDKGISSYDVKSKTIQLASKLKIEKISSNSAKLEKAIKNKILKMEIKGTKKYIIPKDKIKITSFKHIKLDNKNTIYSQVEIDVFNVNIQQLELYTNKKTDKVIDSFKFYMVFMSQKEKVWYIADSAQVHCDHDISNQIDRGDLGYPLEVFNTYDLDNDGELDLISFGAEEILYYIEFGKKLLVIENSDSQYEMWNAPNLL